MSFFTDEGKYNSFGETQRLTQDVQIPTEEEYSLESILAEFGQGAAQPAKKPAEILHPSAEPEKPEDGASPEKSVKPAGNARSAKTEEQIPDGGMPAEEREEAAPERTAEHTDAENAGEEALHRVIAETVAQEVRKESAAKLHRGKKIVDISHIFSRKSGRPETGEKNTAEEPTERPDQPAGYPGEPEGTDEPLNLKQVMSETVRTVLEDDDILEEGEPLRDRLGRLWATGLEKAADVRHRWKERKQDRGHWDEEDFSEPEPDMEQLAREAKNHGKSCHRAELLLAVPVLLLAALAAADELDLMPGLWTGNLYVRFGAAGGLLLLAMLLAVPVWKRGKRELRRRRVGYEAAALLNALVVLADCVCGVVLQRGDNLPFAAPAALMLWVCVLGLRQEADSQREIYHLADLGGRPPYSVNVTASGACKQRGKMEGFYHIASRETPEQKAQSILVPLLLSASAVLAGVVCLGDGKMERFLWIWSALMTASLPLSLPLNAVLPLRRLNHRLVKSGSAVAGYWGACMVSGSKRMVLSDDDLFPRGTVGLNGLKVYGEEIGKVVSYAATVAKAADSQLSPLFEQLLAGEGGVHYPIRDLQFYEEGGFGGTIRGETVTMGSAYFMKKRKIALPRELKLKTGVFLAVDNQLIAVFAIEYQPSRNVEWALRALRRNRIQMVLGVRSGNITPGLLKRKFNLRIKPIYPDISTRVALSDLSAQVADRPWAIIYREGLMPFAETVIGSRRLVSAVRLAATLSYVGAAVGLLLSYYLTHVGGYAALSPLRMLVFLLLWLIPTLLLSGTVKYF